MAQSSRDFEVKFKGDATQLTTTLKGVQKTSATMGQNLSNTAKVVSAAFVGMGIAAGKFGLDSVKAASSLSESIAKSNTVFGQNAGAIQAWSQTTAKSLGVSQQAALEAAGTYGNLFRAFGINEQESAKMSQSLVTLAADLASFNNVPIEDALLALRSGLSGETEPLKRFGIALNEARLKEQALAMGLIKTTTGTLPQAIKTQAAYALILKDSALAQGDVARTSDGLANQMKFLQAGFEDAKAGIGEALLPAMTNLVSYVNSTILPALEGLINGLTGENSVASSFNKSAEAGYNWGRNIRAFIQTVVSYQKPLLVFAGVLAGIWAVSKTVAAVGAIVKVIQTLITVYKALQTTAVLAATAMAFASGGTSVAVGLVGVAAATAGIAAAFVGVNKLVDTYSSKVEDLPKITYTPDGIMGGSSKFTDTNLANIPQLTTGTDTKDGSKAATKKAKDAAKAAADLAKKIADNMAKQVAKATALTTRALEKMNDKLTAAREKLQAAKDAFASFRDGVRDSITGLISFSDAQSSRTGNFLKNLRKQAEGAVSFADKVKQLIKMGLSETGIQQVLAAGADAGGKIANELIAGGAGAITETNKLLESVDKAALALGKAGANQFYKAGVTQGQAMVDGIIAGIKAAGFVMSGGVAALPKPLQNALNAGKLTSGQAQEIMNLVGNSQAVTANNRSAQGTTINLTVNAGMGANGTTIGKDIVDAIKKYERTSGPVFLSA